MFANTVQPSLVSLFSSTSSDPLILASSVRCCEIHKEDSFISQVVDDTDSAEQIYKWHGSPGSVRTMKGKGKEIERGNLRDKVFHLQSPSIRKTSVRWGSLQHTKGSREETGLGITAPFLHLAVKDLSQMFYLDVGVLDDNEKCTIIRASTFQVEARSYSPSATHPALLHFPLQFPEANDLRLTPWSTITLNLPLLLSSFSTLISNKTSLTSNGRQSAFRPSKYASLQFVEVHANCRLRRIWCSNDRGDAEVNEAMALRGMRTELALFAASKEDS